MKILLIHPAWSSVYGKYKYAARLGNLYPPLGLCYIASYLKYYFKEGQIKILDAEIEKLSVFDQLNQIKIFQPDFIGITATSPIFNIAKSFAEQIKLIMDVPICLGGSHATVMPDKVLNSTPAIDFCIVGEGERTLFALVNTLSNGGSIEGIPGLFYRSNNGEVKYSKEKDLIEDLDSLPHPSRDLLKTERYLWSVPGKGIVPFTTIMTSRGCPFGCIFCSARNVFGKTIRKRSIEDVVEEVKTTYRQHNISHYSFIDDTFTLFPDRIASRF